MKVSKHINYRYVLQHELGAGGMGIVYQARDRLTGNTIALKQLSVPVELLKFMSMSTSNNMLLSLANEFELASSLRHPHIVSVLDYGFSEGSSPYLVMEFLQDARPFVDFAREQPLSEQVNLFLQVLQALAYLHRRGVIHRDLKPDNILIVDGKVKVLDFGLSVTRDNVTEIEGTIDYMAPEVLKGESATPQIDLYAIGVMAYELWSGELPFYSGNVKTYVNNIIHQPVDVNHLDVPENLSAIVTQLMAKEPTERFANAQAVMDAFSWAQELLVQESSEVRESFLQAAKFVGREHELDLLSTALSDTMGGDGAIWLVGGESGVGKSRLIDELRTRALVQGVQVFRGQGIAGGGLPYQLWRDVIRRLTLNTELSDLEASVLKEIVPDIEELVGRLIPVAPQLDGKSGLDRLRLTILDVIRRQKQPTLLLLEDLQWTIESLKVVKALSLYIDELPILLIGTYRDDEKSDFAEILDSAVHLKLERLDTDAIQTLSTSIFGEGGARPEFIQLLQNETEGNVFFLVEVVRALAESAGGLSDIVEMTLPNSVFPGGIKQVIQRRLDKIPKQHRHLLTLVAITGRQLDMKVIDQLKDDLDVDEWLLVCQEAAVLEIRDDIWRFSHDKLREAIMAEIPESQRQQVYANVSIAVESLYQGDPTQHPRLYDLWYQAGEVEKILEYVESAVNLQNQIGVSKTALEIIESTFAIAKEAISRTQYLKLQFLRGQAFFHQFQLGQAQEILKATLAEFKKEHLPEETIRCQIALGRTYMQLGQSDLAHETLQSALEQAQSIGARSHSATIFVALSHFEALRDTHVAEQYVKAAVDIYRDLNDQAGVARSLNRLGNAYRDRGKHKLALEALTEAYEIVRQMGPRRNTIAAINNLATAHDYMGNLKEASTFYQLAYDEARRCDSLYLQVATATNLGMVFNQPDDIEPDDSYSREAIALCRRMKPLPTRLYSLVLYHAAYNQILLGHPETALNYATEALTLARETKLDETVVSLYSYMIAAYQMQGQYETAFQTYQTALAEVQQRDTKQYLYILHSESGYLMEAQNRFDEAYSYFQQSLENIMTFNLQENVVNAYADCLLILLRLDKVDGATRLLQHLTSIEHVKIDYQQNLLITLLTLSIARKVPINHQHEIYQLIAAIRCWRKPIISQVRLPYLESLIGDLDVSSEPPNIKNIREANDLLLEALKSDVDLFDSER